MAFRAGLEEQSQTHRSWHGLAGPVHWLCIKGIWQLSPACLQCPTSSGFPLGAPFTVMCPQRQLKSEHHAGAIFWSATGTDEKYLRMLLASESGWELLRRDSGPGQSENCYPCPPQWSSAPCPGLILLHPGDVVSSAGEESTWWWWQNPSAALKGLPVLMR